MLNQELTPTTRIASGWVSAVDAAEFVRAMCIRFPFDARPANLALLPLATWLIGQGVNVGSAYVMAVRRQWLADEMRFAAGGALKDWRSPKLAG